MISTDLPWRVAFLTLIKIGLLGNSSLLCFYTFTLISGLNLRPVDKILNQLVLANCFVLLSKGIPQEMADWGLRYFLDDVGCKLLFYLHRMAREVSLSTTCLLGGFQAFKLCPLASKWMELTVRSPKSINFLCALCWVLSFLLNVHVAVKVKGADRSQNTSMGKAFASCMAPSTSIVTYSLLSSIVFFIDYVLLGLMIWASGSMVLFLHRHKQRVQHIHSHKVSPRLSHEDRATHTILILVTMFVLFYSISSIVTLHMALLLTPAKWLADTSVFMSLCFPTLSPFVLLSSDIRISKLWLAWLEKCRSFLFYVGLCITQGSLEDYHK
uniref:vomeronasal type-1 receptor 1-like n=1 Tax=Jaculus jaculus TaxID=51337 RepID=UPI001E1B172F|nr:vomeronasal type-1 receptor 1-like [Jaculus jaculus]